MTDQIEEIKRKTDIVGVVGQYVALKKSGKNHKGCCPFHAERTPSFMVNEELGVYKCFGCGVGGDVIKFLMEIEGLEFMEALEKLADRLGIKIEKKSNFENDAKKRVYEALSLASEYYHYLLVEHESGKEARKYLFGRGVTEELIKEFKLGFSLNSWDGLVKYLINKKNFTEEELYRAGLVVKRENGGIYDKFRGRIMFPFFDSGGKIVGFSGRVIPGISSDQEAKYMNTPETEVFHKGELLYGFYQAKQSIRKIKRVVMVEGQMDMISSYSSGVWETVAAGGTALTDDQVEMIARLANKIVFAQDADSAGEAAIKRSIQIAEKRGLSIKIVNIIGGKDPDEIARNNPEEWKKMVDGAISVYEWIILKAVQRYSGSNDRVKEIATEVVPYLSKIEGEIEKDRWISKLAEVLEVDKESVRKDVFKGYVSEKKAELVEKKETEVDKLNEWRMMLVANMMLADMDVRKQTLGWFVGLDVEDALGKVMEYLCKSTIKDWKSLRNEMGSEFEGIISNLALLDVGDELGEKDIKKLSGKILREILEKKMAQMQRQMEEFEKVGNEDGAARLAVEVGKMNKKYNEITAILA